jgi:Dyp-type peroxidase family
VSRTVVSGRAAPPAGERREGATDRTTLELGDIQAGVLHPRPTPYAATYLLFRIDKQAAGRALLGRLEPYVASAGHPASPAGAAWLSVALSYEGLRALGLPADSLSSFSAEFQQGMAARAIELGDVGRSAPMRWEHPFGTGEVHVVVAALAPDRAQLESVLDRVRRAGLGLRGLSAVARLDCCQLPTGREPFGFRDGISQPAIEGSSLEPSNPREAPLKAGEFVLGYRDESGQLPPQPWPEVLGRNGSYAAFRKLSQDVAGFRRYLATQATDPADQEWLAAKMMGRWRSGAPLVLCPEGDDPELGADPRRNNDFLYADDREGFKCPLGAHARRMNPRDQLEHGAAQVRRHRLIRRGTVYGPPLPEGVLEDDGVDRGILFVFVGADLRRQFEFVQTEWVNQGLFIGQPGQADPICGPNDGTGLFTIPKRPVRRRVGGLPQFVTNRGGEYLFLPGLRALRWLAAGQYAGTGTGDARPLSEDASGVGAPIVRSSDQAAEGRRT